ncbi:MAG: efflux RND transporter permease subunit [Bacteriovoracaceae bacterium]|nr:efflux RND transporter permease subunit [Bacteriovoracaceae bacterium]
MKTLAKFFINNYKLTIVISAFMVVYGWMGINTMNSESFPSVDIGVAIITTSYDGASAEDIEIKITKPIEDEVRSVSGVKDVKSVSQSGLSTIVVRLDIDNVDVESVMSDLQKAVDRVSNLPFDLGDPPKFKELNSEEFPVVEIAIKGSNIGRFRDLAADELKDEIEDIKDVLSIQFTGFVKRAFQVELDTQKLKKYHIGIDEVLSKIKHRNVNRPAGHIKDDSKQTLLRVEGKIKSNKDLENILIRSNFSGQKIYLRDVANILDDEEEKKIITRLNGEECTLLIINKKGGADTISLVKMIMKKIKIFNKRYQNKLTTKIYHNEGLEVKNRLEVLFSNAISGLVLVIIFLLLFLPGKIGVVASFSLPLAVLTTFGAMFSLGMNLNAVTILALVIALGMLVDNSVVISENFNRLRSEGENLLEAALDSVAQLWLPITATAFTTIATFLPMLVTRGVMGEFIKNIPIVVTFALLISLLESFFLLPMRLVKVEKLFGKNKQDKTTKHDWFEPIADKFEWLMSKFVRQRYIVAFVFIITVSFSLYIIVKINKFILFPAEETKMYFVRFQTPRGTVLKKTDQVLTRLMSDIKNKMGDKVEHIVGRAGTSSMGVIDPRGKVGNNAGVITIYVSDYVKFNYPHTEILNTLRSINTDYVNKINFEAQINGPPVGDPINGKFRSNNMEALTELVDKVIIDLNKVNGVFDIQLDDVVGDDQIYIDINHVKADRLGLNVDLISNTIKTAISGKKISDVNLNNKDVDLFVRFGPSYRRSVDDLKSIKIMDKRGNLISLGDLASFRKEEGSIQIKRFDYKRTKTLTANVDEKIITAFEATGELKKIYAKYESLYPEVSLVFGGMEETTKESLESLFQAQILSLIGVFGLLVFVFGSYLRPIIIMSTIPLGFLGFSVAFYFHDKPTSFLSLIGMVGLGGIIVNSGIILISFIDNMIDSGHMSLEQALVKASRIRLRAVLVTSLTTISGLMPTAYGIGGSDAILIPMTMAMAWGLTSGTILTLVWVPCAYAILEDFNQLVKKIFQFNKQRLIESEACSD